MANEKMQILKHLMVSKESLSIRQLALKRKINYKSAYNAVSKLKEEGIIEVKELGNISLCSYNNKFNDSVYLIQSQRREEILTNRNLKVIYNKLKSIKKQFILILFGSYSRKEQTRKSDIDLLLIADDKKQIQNELDLLPLTIHLTHITYDDFKDMQNKENVVSEAKNGIILFGIEDYYRLKNG